MVTLFHNYLMNVLQKIFRDNYEIIQYTLHPRDVVMESIDKMINCGDSSFGGAKYCNDRATAMSFKLIKCPHRHCVFTINEELRHFFLEDRSLLNCLFSSVRSVVLNMFYKANKSKNFVPGVVCILHTFGRPLEWNPHIHCLITEVGFSDDGFWQNIRHFNSTYLRKAFLTALLNELENQIGPSFKKSS